MIHEIEVTQQHIDIGQPGDFFLDAFTLALNDRFDNVPHDTYIDSDGAWISVAKNYDKERIAYICDSEVKQWLTDYYSGKIEAEDETAAKREATTIVKRKGGHPDKWNERWIRMADNSFLKIGSEYYRGSCNREEIKLKLLSGWFYTGGETSSVNCYTKVEGYYRDSFFSAASVYFERALQINNRESDDDIDYELRCRYKLAMCYRIAKQIPKALNMYRSAVSSRCAIIEAWDSNKFTAGFFQELINEANWDSKEHELVTRYKLGLIHERSGDLDSALDTYKMAIFSYDPSI